MDAKQTLIIALKALVEIKEAVPINILVDLLIGKENNTIQESGYDETEAFGSGEGHEEEYWNNLIEAAIETGYIKIKAVKAQTLTITPAGKKFLKKPGTFVIKDDEDYNEEIKEEGIDDIVKSALKSKKQTEQKTSSSARTRQQIKIIQAIDRKIALDDFAENEGIDLNVVLDELEELVQMRMHIDITYFTNEVLGENCVNELVEYFSENDNDSIEDALEEYGDVYNAEEIRLARIVYRSNKS